MKKMYLAMRPAVAAGLALLLSLSLVACDGSGESKEGEQAEEEAKPKPAPKPVEPEPEPEPEEDPKAKAEAELAKKLLPPTNLRKAPADAKKLKAGIKTKVITPGKGGQTPRPDDIVWVHYTAWDQSGNVIASSYKSKRPKNTRLHKLHDGWETVLSQMTEGEVVHAWMPAKQAFTKSQRRSGKGKDKPAVFEFNLVVHKVAPDAPKDVKKPPKDALLTPLGVAFKELKPATGDKKPTAKSQVTVKYAGWTTDGRCFDFTPTDETTSFSLDGVIKGWTDGLQLMAEGQKVRFWIPEKLAYAGQEGKPQGMLVFDIELVSVDS